MPCGPDVDRLRLPTDVRYRAKRNRWTLRPLRGTGEGWLMQTEAVDQVGPGEAAQWTPPSWEDVVREHSARVYRLAYRLTGNNHDAEDLTQEVFVRAFRSLPTYTPGTFDGLLHRITTNLV